MVRSEGRGGAPWLPTSERGVAATAAGARSGSISGNRMSLLSSLMENCQVLFVSFYKSEEFQEPLDFFSLFIFWQMFAIV